MTKLTPAQEAKMKEHKKNHTAQHMKNMKASMMKGKSFTAAHKIAKAADAKKSKAS
jgi:hypothetical protein|tara:strand:+ start:422 stop:589 length:168 start_codon:yes stop_codon:yes gene_type:complete